MVVNDLTEEQYADIVTKNIMTIIEEEVMEYCNTFPETDPQEIVQIKLDSYIKGMLSGISRSKEVMKID